MQSYSMTHRSFARLGCLMVLCSAALGCAPAAESTKIPPSPIVFRWYDPAFLPEIQCHGGYTVAELEQYLPSAQVALQLPGTRAVAVDQERGCLTVIVDGIGAGRLAALVLRGVAVPRSSYLLLITTPEPQG
jgi:hypothetical protein